MDGVTNLPQKNNVIQTEGKILTIRLKDTSTENNKAKDSKEDE